ncbi:MAG: methylmalonyl-CoA mutase family protein [Balneolaceae bacterium]|nr:methylmalonyl-CoA mutase family protein [Balneolaceae bacterium]MDR9409012.1 methylmalonyl-CoA mutase family protein [Balneolaceae bacterium]
MTTNKNGQKKRLWDFEPVSKIKWEEKINQDLKGADYKSKLFWNSHEGFTAAPFYTQEDLQNLEHNAKKTIIDRTGWTCCEPIYETAPGDANEAMKTAIEKDSASFQIRSKSSWKSGMLGGDMYGTQIQKQADLDRLMDGIDTESVEFTFDSGMTTPALVAMMNNHPKKFNNPKFVFDPFTYIAERGRLPFDEKKLKEIVNQLVDQKNYKTLCADGLFYHRTGATIVQELALALATASEYLSLIDEEKKESAADEIFVRLAAGPLYFPEIAKFRVIRLLWDQLMEAYGFENPPKLTVIAETSKTNKTITDPHNNLIRTITESMSAVLGGVNQLMVHPYNTLESTPGNFSRRIARNIQYILRDESHFDKVADPSAGSYYIENLTSTIAKEAWEYFQRIENEGGVLQSLKNGSIQEVINRSKAEREKAVNQGKKVLVGTNYYANAEEELPDTIDAESFADSLELTDFEHDDSSEDLIQSLQNAFKNEATVGDVIEAMLKPEKVLYQVVEETRLGSVFDEIRLRTKSLSEETEIEPVVHLVPVGDVKWRNARATFSHNTLGCGGFKIDHPTGYDSIDEAAEKIEFGEADLFVLCSSDKEYEEFVEPFCDAFSDKGICILAGHPGDNEESYRAAGMDLFIHKGMDIPALLLNIQNDLFKIEKDHETT